MLNYFSFWKHYQEQYLKILNGAGVEAGEYEEWLVKDGQVLVKPGSS